MRRWMAGLFVGALAGFAFSVASSIGCSNNHPNGGGDGGAGDGGATCGAASSCTSVGDCPSSSNFKCDTTSSCCVFFCNTAADCGGQWDPGDSCKASALGCVCDQGVCKSKQCSADSDCGSGQVCKGGNCQAPDPASAAAAVVVQPNPAVAHVGAAVQFTATVLKSDGTAVILAPGSITWSDSGNGTIDQTGKFTPSTASTKLADTTVTATVGSVNGSAGVTIYGPPASGQQITVLDAATNVPITDATVEFTDATGAAIGSPVTSGSALGVYTLPATPANAFMLSVFEANYQYVSLVIPTGGFGSSDLVVLLAQNTVTTQVNGASAPVAGGYTGDFKSQPGILDPGHGEPASAAGYIHVGIAGTAVPQDLLDISLSALLGPSHDVTINIGGPHTVGLPQGVELGFGTSWFQCRYHGLGAAGGCGICSGGNTTNCMNPTDMGTDPTQESWANSVFACGTRSAWGLGGGVPFSAISGQLGAVSTGGVNVGSLLAALLPEFSSFNSGVFFQTPYTLEPTVPASQVDDACTNAPYTDQTPIPDPTKLTQPTSVPLSLDTPLALVENVTLPALPSVGGSCQATALVLGGAIEPGYGLLPLGLSAGTINDQNNSPSKSCKVYDGSGTASGKVVMNMAPEHGGVERDNYGVVALSLDVGAIGGSSSGKTAISGLVYTGSSMPYGSSVTFPAGGFLPYAEHATYAPTPRTFTNDTAIAKMTNVSWMRLRFQDNLGREWITYFPTATAGFVLPTPPGQLADRSVNGTSAASPEAQLVETIPTVTYATYFDFTNGAQGEDLIDEMTGFSAVGL